MGEGLADGWIGAAWHGMWLLAFLGSERAYRVECAGCGCIGRGLGRQLTRVEALGRKSGGTRIKWSARAATLRT